MFVACRLNLRSDVPKSTVIPVADFPWHDVAGRAPGRDSKSGSGARASSSSNGQVCSRVFRVVSAARLPLSFLLLVHFTCRTRVYAHFDVLLSFEAPPRPLVLRSRVSSPPTTPAPFSRDALTPNLLHDAVARLARGLLRPSLPGLVANPLLQ